MKRKQYAFSAIAGQNSDYSAERVADNELTVVQNVFLNKGEADGDLVGTLALKTGFSAEPLRIHHFKSSDGYEYILTWGDDGAVNYYCVTTSGAVVADLKTGLSAYIPPKFVNWGNEYIIMLAGKDGNYKITSSGGTLSITELTTVPPASHGFIDNGMLYIAQDTSLIHSAPGNPLRWTPTLTETQSIPPIYTLDYRINFADAGVLGETIAAFTWKGIKFLFTQYDLFVLLWDGQSQAWPTRIPGYGPYGYLSYTLLDDRIRFFSSYKQGTILEMVGGSAGGRGETYTIGQNVFLTILEPEGCAKIADVLRQCPAPTARVKQLAVDSQADWQDTAKIATATGFNTTANPGWIFLDGAVKIALAAESCHNIYSELGVLTKFFSALGTLGSDGDDADIDAKPAEQPATTPAPTYLQYTMTGYPYNVSFPSYCVWSADLNSAKLYYYLDGVTRREFVDKGRNTNNISETAGWTSYLLEKGVNTTSIEAEWSFRVGLRTYDYPSGVVTTYKDIIIKRQWNFSPQMVSKLYLYGVSTIKTGSPTEAGITFGLKIGEVNIYGSPAGGTAVITSAVMSMSGLTPSSLASLGQFFIAYEGTGENRDGGLTGTSPTGVEIGLSKNGTDWTGANGAVDILTASELKTGYKLKDLAITTTAAGLIYTRVRIPFTLDAGLSSAAVDKLLWDFYTGAARTSIFPMFTWRDKTILSLMDTASTECDKAVIINENGGCSVMEGVHWLAGLNLKTMTPVTAGKTLGKLGEGTNNLIWDGAASTDTPTTKILTTKKLFGMFKAFCRKVLFGITKYTPEETAITINAEQAISSDNGETCCKVAWNQTTDKIYALTYIAPGVTKMAVVNGDTGEREAIVDISYYPAYTCRNAYVNEVTNKAYTYSGFQYINEIDGATNTNIPIDVNILAGGTRGISDICLDTTRNKIIAVSSSAYGKVIIIDGLARTLDTEISLNKTPVRVLVNETTNKTYVLCSDYTVQVINGATYAVTNISTGVNYPEQLVINETTNKIYVFCNGGTTANSLIEIDGATGIVTPITVGTTFTGGYSDMYADETNNRVYFTHYADKKLYAVDGTNLSVTSLTVGNGLRGLAVDLVSDRAVVTNALDGTVQVISIPDLESLLTITVNSTPYDVASNPTTGKSYVVHNADVNSVLFIHGNGKMELQRNWGTEADITSVTIGTGKNLTGYDALRLLLYIEDWKNATTKNGEIRWNLLLTVTATGGNVYTYTIPTKGLANEYSTTSRKNILLDISGILVADTSSTLVLSVYGDASDASYRLRFLVGDGDMNNNIYGVTGPLEIYGIADGAETLIHQQAGAISSLTFIPVNTPAQRTIQGGSIQAKLKTKGQVKVTGAIMEYDMAEGGRE